MTLLLAYRSAHESRMVINTSYALPTQTLQVLTQLLQLVSLLLLRLHELHISLLCVLVVVARIRSVAIVYLTAIEGHDGLRPLDTLQRRHSNRTLPVPLSINHGSLPDTLHLARDITRMARCCIGVRFSLHAECAAMRLVELMHVTHAIVMGALWRLLG